MWGILLFAIAVIGIDAEASNVYLSQDRLSQAIDAQYGSGSFVGSCASCHQSTNPPVMNSSFGNDFVNMGAGRGGMSVAQLRTVLANIENLDSDGDTHINMAEYLGESDPGDQNSVPQPNPTPTPTPDPTPVPPPGGGGNEGAQDIVKQTGSETPSLNGNKMSSGCAMVQSSMNQLKEESMEATTALEGLFFILLLLPLVIAAVSKIRIEEMK